MKVVIMTREYPPHVYGGAGVHLEYLCRELARMATVEVKCFGDQRLDFGNPSVHGYPFGSDMFEGNPRRVRQSLMVLQSCLHFNAAPVEADVVHCHTWYAMWGGILAKICYGVPLVITVHSLEPLRPWKREQLGRGYDLSSWVEKSALEMADAVIAVSESDRREIANRFQVAAHRLHVIPNGIDTSQYRPVTTTSALTKYGIDPDRPYVLFLGRVTRQKGISHFIAASRRLKPEIQVVICAAAPDSPEYALEIERSVETLQKERGRVIWLQEMVMRPEAIELYSHAAVFCCPSIYEPFGIINLEAMACETPVVASCVGGIKDVVVQGETGFLVNFDPVGADNSEPAEPQKFAVALAARINELVADEKLRHAMGRKGRQRVVANFGWGAVAEKVFAVYAAVKEKE
ncbi:MAG: glycogen synthase [Proteobacteria bacterium]|nr:glycogen synthase [Pseudomonadota bacterium]MBU1687094.1 glycogen synthase [Pseudomonadota bacterium]